MRAGDRVSGCTLRQSNTMREAGGIRRLEDGYMKGPTVSTPALMCHCSSHPSDSACFPSCGLESIRDNYADRTYLSLGPFGAAFGFDLQSVGASQL